MDASGVQQILSCGLVSPADLGMLVLILQKQVYIRIIIVLIDAKFGCQERVET